MSRSSRHGGPSSKKVRIGYLAIPAIQISDHGVSKQQSSRTKLGDLVWSTAVGPCRYHKQIDGKVEITECPGYTAFNSAEHFRLSCVDRARSRKARRQDRQSERSITSLYAARDPQSRVTSLPERKDDLRSTRRGQVPKAGVEMGRCYSEETRLSCNPASTFIATFERDTYPPRDKWQIPKHERLSGLQYLPVQ